MILKLQSLIIDFCAHISVTRSKCLALYVVQHPTQIQFSSAVFTPRAPFQSPLLHVVVARLLCPNAKSAVALVFLCASQLSRSVANLPNQRGWPVWSAPWWTTNAGVCDFLLLAFDRSRNLIQPAVKQQRVYNMPLKRKLVQ